LLTGEIPLGTAEACCPPDEILPGEAVLPASEILSGAAEEYCLLVKSYLKQLKYSILLSNEILPANEILPGLAE
jgi:hypothetical protein